MNDIESWFYILENIHNFAGEPGDLGKRFTQVMEVAQTDALPDKNKLQYLQAMVSESERLDIGQAYFEDGLEEGIAKGKAEGFEQMAEAMRQEGMSEDDIQRILARAKNS